MKSMTGYGFADYHDDKLRLVIELRSYNNRFLDIGVSLPPAYGRLEPRVRAYLAERIERGRVELAVRAMLIEEELSVMLDSRVARTYTDALRRLAEAAGIRAEVSLDHLLMIEGILKNDGLLKVERDTDVESFWELLRPHLDQTFEEFERTRTNEGARTEADILANLAVIERLTQSIAARADELEETIKKNLRERFAELLGESYDEGRLLAETAVMLVKSTINEEVQRIGGHLASFRSIASSGEPVGKRLDFLCQELGREVNTIGSKSTILEISQAVIELKDALEKIREQLRNVE